MRIGVFLHGTAIMHAAAVGVPRPERVEQVRRRDPSIRRFGSYVPTPGTAAVLAEWRRRGATLVYLSSQRSPEDLAADATVVRRWLPRGRVCGRAPGETYGGLAERLGLDLVIEDDCESIGGLAQTVRADLAAGGHSRIPCLVRPEFAGLGDLPACPEDLLRLAGEGGPAGPWP